MGMGMGGGGGTVQTPEYKTKGEKLTRALVIEDVKIVEVRKEIEIPVMKYVEKEQVKYVTHEEPQVKYVTQELNTVKYNIQEKDTVKFNTKEVETVRYIPKEVQVERPVPIPVEYEKPIIKEKVVEIFKYLDVVLIKEVIDNLKTLRDELAKVKGEVDGLKKYKLVEEVVKVPKIEWVNTPVERIVWKDIERPRPNANQG
jgi:hypothetical protein